MSSQVPQSTAVSALTSSLVPVQSVPKFPANAFAVALLNHAAALGMSAPLRLLAHLEVHGDAENVTQRELAARVGLPFRTLKLALHETISLGLIGKEGNSYWLTTRRAPDIGICSDCGNSGNVENRGQDFALGKDHALPEGQNLALAPQYRHLQKQEGQNLALNQVQQNKRVSNSDEPRIKERACAHLSTDVSGYIETVLSIDTVYRNSTDTGTENTISSNESEEKEKRSRECLVANALDPEELPASVARLTPDEYVAKISQATILNTHRKDRTRIADTLFQHAARYRRGGAPKPDHRIVAQMAAVATPEQLYRVLKPLTCTGNSYGWYLTVFANHWHGMKADDVAEARSRAREARNARFREQRRARHEERAFTLDFGQQVAAAAAGKRMA